MQLDSCLKISCDILRQNNLVFLTAILIFLWNDIFLNSCLLYLLFFLHDYFLFLLNKRSETPEETVLKDDRILHLHRKVISELEVNFCCCCRHCILFLMFIEGSLTAFTFHYQQRICKTEAQSYLK